MTYFALQSMALLLASYFIGCIFGCFLRSIEARPERRAVPIGRTARVAEPAQSFPPAPVAVAPQVNPETSRRFRETLEGPGGGLPATPMPRTTAPAPQVAPVAPIVVQPPVATAALVADDLKRIKGIGPELERRLNQLGVTRYLQIAGWTANDVRRFNSELGQDGRIQHENWIEQAQILGRGDETAFSRRVDRKEVLASPTDTWSPQAPVMAAAPKPAVAPPQPAPAPQVMAPQPTKVSAPVQQAAAAPSTSPIPAGAPAFVRLNGPRGVPDDLARIAGIGDSTAATLNKLGIFHYWQIAAMSPADVARIEDQAGLKGRIGREEWVEQARELLAGKPPRARVDRERTLAGEPEPSSPPGPGAIQAQPQPPRPADVTAPVATAPSGVVKVQPQPAAPPVSSGLVSAAPVVASPAAAPPPANPTAAVSAPSAASPSQPIPASPPATGAPRMVRAATADDLKRIKGIGVVIENKLRSMGITSYAQISQWVEADIERVSQALDFRGRIERENWIDQAKILARGGQTDFSRRVDRGELPKV